MDWCRAESYVIIINYGYYFFLSEKERIYYKLYSSRREFYNYYLIPISHGRDFEIFLLFYNSS